MLLMRRSSEGARAKTPPPLRAYAFDMLRAGDSERDTRRCVQKRHDEARASAALRYRCWRDDDEAQRAMLRLRDTATLALTRCEVTVYRRAIDAVAGARI